MSNDKVDWDIFAENHFLGRVQAANEQDALLAGIRLFGSHLEGILQVRQRSERYGRGWSRPI